MHKLTAVTMGNNTLPHYERPIYFSTSMLIEIEIIKLLIKHRPYQQKDFLYTIELIPNGPYKGKFKLRQL